MKEMFICGTPLLESVGLLEPAVAELRERVRHALRQAAIPLRAYARQYECHLELHNSDIDTFLRCATYPAAMFTSRHDPSGDLIGG